MCVFVVCTIYTYRSKTQRPPTLHYCHPSMYYTATWPTLRPTRISTYVLKVCIRRIAATFHSVIKKFFTENNYTATLFDFDIHFLYTNMCVSMRILTLFVIHTRYTYIVTCASCILIRHKYKFYNRVTNLCESTIKTIIFQSLSSSSTKPPLLYTGSRFIDRKNLALARTMDFVNSPPLTHHHTQFKF